MILEHRGRILTQLSQWDDGPEDGRNLSRHFSCLGGRLKLLVNVSCMLPATSTNRADCDNLRVFVDAVDDTMRRKFVLPVPVKRCPQRRAISLRVNDELLLKNLLELLLDAAVEAFNVTRGIGSE